MQEISEIPLINTEREKVLAKRIKAGDEEARAELIQSNLRLVVKIAHDFKTQRLTIPDLVSEGNIGLMRAAEKFDPEKGAKFSSYAAWWIKQGMRRAIQEQRKTIRIPATAARKIYKIRKTRAELKITLSRDPSDAEIAAKVDFSERVVRGLSFVEQDDLSLQDPLGNNDGDGLRGDLVADEHSRPPDEVLQETDLYDELFQHLGSLDTREQHILRIRYGLDGAPKQTLEEVSQIVHRTRERVRQIQKRALAKLRKKLGEEENEIPNEPLAPVIFEGSPKIDLGPDVIMPNQIAYHPAIYELSDTVRDDILAALKTQHMKKLWKQIVEEPRITEDQLSPHYFEGLPDLQTNLQEIGYSNILNLDADDLRPKLSRSIKYIASSVCLGDLSPDMLEEIQESLSPKQQTFWKRLLDNPNLTTQDLSASEQGLRKEMIKKLESMRYHDILI